MTVSRYVLTEHVNSLGWSNIWRFWLVSTWKYQWKMKELHEKYGPVVRIGPNLLDLDYPELIKTLYSTSGKYTKVSGRYPSAYRLGR